MIEVRVHDTRGSVSGVVAFTEPARVRSLEAFVSYGEHTAQFSHVLMWLRSGPLAEGEIAAGTEIPFSVELPERPYAAVSTQWGTLGWELVVKADIPKRKDVQQATPLQLAA